MSENSQAEGILFQQDGKAVPLEGVEVHGNIIGRGAKVKISQKFRNTEEKPIEAVYKFPLPENAAICGFRALIDDRIVEGKIEEKEKAFELYDKALAEGHKAQLMDEERPNIFTLSVGNIKPDSSVIIEITYITLLDSHDSEVRFYLPTTISPRYTPKTQEDEDGIPVHDIVNPPFALQVPYGLTININVHDRKAISSIESPSHTINNRVNGYDAIITFSSDKAAMDRDFVLTIAYEKAFTNRAFLFKDHDETFIQVDITPEEISETGKTDNLSKGREIVFVLDCSGSMNGESIEEARKALEIMIRALNPDTMFNMYRFGNRFESLYPKSKSYNENSMKKALKYLSKTDASFGGTEVLAPLADIYKKELSAGYRRDVILITDGEISNEDEVMKLVKSHADTTTLSTVGIGSGPNEFLIKGVARAAGGASELIAPKERIEPKILRLFQKVMTGSMSSLKINCGIEIDQAPIDPVAYMLQRTSIFAKIKDGNLQSKFVKVTGNTRAGLREWNIDIEELNNTDLPISKLWAREKIRDLEEGSGSLKGSKQRIRSDNKINVAIIDISRKYGIISRSTSFIGIEKKSDTETITDMDLRIVPSSITKGWHGDRSMAKYSIRDMPTLSRISSVPQTVVAESAPLYSLSTSVYNKIQAALHIKQKDLLLDILSLQRAGGGFDIHSSVEDLLRISRSEIQSVSNKMVMQNEIEDILHTFPSALQNITHNMHMEDLISAKDGRPNVDFLIEEILRTFNSKLRRIAADINTKYQADRMGILGTALVLAMLELIFGERRDEWDGVVSKSRNWLHYQIEKVRPTIEHEPLENWVNKFVKGRLRP